MTLLDRVGCDGVWGESGMAVYVTPGLTRGPFSCPDYKGESYV